MEVELSHGDVSAALFETGHGGDVVEQVAETVNVVLRALEEVGAHFVVHAFGCQHGVEIAFDNTHGGLELVVDIVGHLTLDARFFLYGMHSDVVFALTFFHGLSALAIEAHDVAGNFAEFVVRELGFVEFHVGIVGLRGKVAEQAYASGDIGGDPIGGKGDDCEQPHEYQPECGVGCRE